MEEMDLRELFHVLWNRKVLIIVLTLVALVSSFVVSSYVLHKEYETHTTLILGKPKDYESQQIEYQDVLLNQKLVSTYSEIAKSRLVVSEIIDNLGLDMTFEQLSKSINVSLVSNTEVIKITVTGLDPEQITQIANEGAQVFKKHVSEIMQIDNVKIIDVAVVPDNPVRPNVMLNTAIAGVLGIMVSVFIIFVMEALDDTVKSPNDVEHLAGIPVLGMIPDFDEEIKGKMKKREYAGGKI